MKVFGAPRLEISIIGFLSKPSFIKFGIEIWTFGVPRSRFSHGNVGKQYFFAKIVLFDSRVEFYILFKRWGRLLFPATLKTSLKIEGLGVV